MKNVKKKFSVLLIVMFAIMAVISLMYVSMLVWAGANSLKDAWEYDDSALALPQIIDITNYARAFTAYSVKLDNERVVGTVEIIINTILYAGGCAFLGTLVPCMTAYVVSKYKFRVLKIYYFTVIVCLSIPIIGGAASQIQIAYSLNMYDTIWGIWLMRGYFIGSYFLIFYSSFMVIPDSFTEAAKIDGAGNFSILVRIMMPLISKTFTTVLLILFVQYWNEYETPLMFTPSVPTLAVGLYKFGLSSENSSIPVRLAGSMILFIPIFILYIFLQDKLMGNISMGGVKE